MATSREVVVSLPSPNQVKQIGEWIVRNDGEGYGTRLRRLDTSGTSVVIVEWTHPNYGYWSDAGVYIWMIHMDGWFGVFSTSWGQKYGGKSGLARFLTDYAWSVPLFDGQPGKREQVDFIPEER